MMATKQDIDAALARLAETFPQTFVLEKYRPHWPLKVGIASAIPAGCPALERRVLKMALTAYTGRVMYLKGMVAGAAGRSRRQPSRRGDRQGRRICCGQARRDPGVARNQAARGCGQRRGAGCEAGGSKGGGCGASSRKGRDPEEKAPSAPAGVPATARHPSDRRIRSRDPTASVVLRSLNPGDAGIRGCLNTRDSNTKFYWRFRPAGVPGFSLPGGTPTAFSGRFVPLRPGCP